MIRRALFSLLVGGVLIAVGAIIAPASKATADPLVELPYQSTDDLDLNFVSPTGIAVASDGAVYIADLQSPAILAYETNGVLEILPRDWPSLVG